MQCIALTVTKEQTLMWNGYQPYRRGIRFFPHIIPIGKAITLSSLITSRRHRQDHSRMGKTTLLDSPPTARQLSPMTSISRRHSIQSACHRCSNKATFLLRSHTATTHTAWSWLLRREHISKPHPKRQPAETISGSSDQTR